MLRRTTVPGSCFPDPLLDEDQLLRAHNHDISAMTDRELAAEIVAITNELAAEVRHPSRRFVSVTTPPYAVAYCDYLEDRLGRLRAERRARQVAPR